MNADPYLLVRLIPQSPVDGATFSTYLDGLALQAVDTVTGEAVSALTYSSPLSLFRWQGSATLLAAVSEPTSQDAAKGSATLKVTSTDGISVGAYVFTSNLNFTTNDDIISPGDGLQVSAVSATGTVSLEHSGSAASLTNYVPAATVVTFLGSSPSADPMATPAMVFSLDTTAPATTLDGQAQTASNPLRVLHFDTADGAGITAGMGVSGTGVTAGSTVTQVRPDDSGSGADVVVSLPLSASPTSVTLTLSPPFAHVTRTPLSGTPSAAPQTLTFAAPDTEGIAVGMTLEPMADPSNPGANLIAPGTKVTAATATTLTLSRPLLAPLPAGTAIGFVFPLGSGVFQHVEEIPDPFTFLGLGKAIVPAAVATAIIRLNTPPAPQHLPDYLTVRIVAVRGAELIPVATTFHNVLVHTADLPSTPDQYQAITPKETSLYLALPPQPGANPIPLAIPEDGSPPPFDPLVAAIEAALVHDPIAGASTSTLITDPAQCRRVAYDIVWSSQNTLPTPPDPLESLYTNPPNPGGGGGNDGKDSGSQNNFEQDRQKFEGELNSFYATRDANAERLAKFVAAASAAIVCEQTSLNATSALLGFPVDPTAASVSTAVNSELLLQGVAAGGAAGPSFGVPAAFFYALGAHLDKATTVQQRFQMAAGDAIERLLQQLSSAVDTKVINPQEGFTTLPAAPPTPPISTFKAARRLVALRVSTDAGSAAASATMVTGSALAGLVQRWLLVDTPAAAAQNPPPTYADLDFTAWQQLDAGDPGGYLALDLAALTQGYAIPALSLRPLHAESGGSTSLRFATGSGIGPGMSVSGPGLAAGTQVSALTFDTTVSPVEAVATLSAALTGDVSVTTDLNVNAGLSTLADQIAAWLPGPGAKVTTLKEVTAKEWNDFFTLTAGPAWLPPFTQPVAVPGPLPAQVAPTAGYLAVRIRAFVRAVQRFFTVSSLATSAVLPPVDAPPIFDVPSADLIGQVIGQLPAGFTFGSPLNAAQLDTAVQSLGTDLDPAAQAWLVQTVTTINELATIAAVAPAPNLHGHTLPYPVSPVFAVMEALYARGFRSAADIKALSAEDFQLAMTGTIAYDFATGTGSLYDKAEQLATSRPPEAGPGGPFAPVNPGSLIDCRPPATLSPTGPIAYLQELLRLTPTSDCAEPFDPEADPETTLGAVVGARRGPLGDLRADRANLDTPLPLRDLVNECLEYLGAVQPPADGSTPGAPGGTIYDTAEGELAGLPLGADPGERFAAVPQYSTPAPPAPGSNQAVSPLVYDRLRSAFSSCRLPYAQALDVSRSYLRHLGSNRFEQMRTFRKCITEFVLDPTGEPSGFQDWLWRYPVRTELAIEYLGITPDAYTTLYQGDVPPPCLPPEQNPDATAPTEPTGDVNAVSATGPGGRELEGGLALPDFLSRAGLTYCEFRELWQSGFVTFSNGADPKTGLFDACEPCCPQEVWLQFGQGRLQQDLARLLTFVRLWRTLRERDGCGYSFAHLRQICEVLRLYVADALNPDFVRQLAAFQMLREILGPGPADHRPPFGPAPDPVDPVGLLTLWADPSDPARPEALEDFAAGLERHAIARYRCRTRAPRFRKILVANLDRLSALSGFDPDSPTDSWHARPTHTLRFAEVLTKIYAGDFSVGELLFLFTGEAHLEGDDPFALPPANEALDSPLSLPDDDHRDGLWQLRRALLGAEVDQDEAPEWPWERLAAALDVEFGFSADDIAALARHFFPRHSAGRAAPAASFVSDLPAASTSAPMWNSDPEGPLRYNPADAQLTVRLPLADHRLIVQLEHVRQLSPDEQRAVQDLYFQPRALLARFAMLFEDFATAAAELIEQDDEDARFEDFRRAFLLCRRRAHLIAAHLSRHVRRLGDSDEAEHAEVVEDSDTASREQRAVLVLRTLAADENLAVASWENDSGTPPDLTWTKPAGGGLAALLGLLGTGLLAEYQSSQGTLAWRDLSGPLLGFGSERDRQNSPVPTVLPSFGATLGPQQQRFATSHNGYLMKDRTGEWLGGADGFQVTWSGALLVEHDGGYEFWSAISRPGEHGGEHHGEHAAPGRAHRWRVRLSRGQRSWVILSHRWEDEPDQHSSALPLRAGTYNITVEFVQEPPRFRAEDETRHERTGLDVSYRGPDTDGERTPIPQHRLFTVSKSEPLGSGLTPLGPAAGAYLAGRYSSSLRDIRRTYQRAFKALLLVERFALSARPHAHDSSELGYLLAQAPLFAGSSYYRSGTSFTTHRADLDLDFLPVLDSYLSPGTDARTAPSAQRSAALFDWWERIFDYGEAREELRRRAGRHFWHLFAEAQERRPAHPGYLLRHLGADERHWQLDLRYFQSQSATPGVYAVTSTDLQDERWSLRTWHAEAWLRSLQNAFSVTDITTARPDLWAGDDPAAAIGGETITGNADLFALLSTSLLADGTPGRIQELARVNNGLRERGRQALLAYLCADDRIALPWAPGAFATSPADLSDLLLLDVEAGRDERASRIEEAITAVQTFVRRARLGLEPGWVVGAEFARLWDSRFATLRTWQLSRARELYRENWIEWDELEQARRIEAFRFLESELQTSTLSLAVPGGLDWWPGNDGPAASECGPELLQRRVPSALTALHPLPQTSTREGLSTLGSPEAAASPTWLAAAGPPAAVESSPTDPGGEPGDGQPGDGQPDGGEPGPQLADVRPVAAQPATSQSGGPAALAALAASAAVGAATPQSLPLWMESAAKLGTRFLRVAAAAPPPAALAFTPRLPGGASCCTECGHEHPITVDEYYFWLIDGEYYAYDAETDSQDDGATKFTGSYQSGFQDSYYDRFQQQSSEWDDPGQVVQLLAKWKPERAVRLGWCRVHSGGFGQPRSSDQYVPIASPADLVFLGRAEDSLHFYVLESGDLQQLPAGYGQDGSPPGFRYDLPSDQALALPQVLKPPTPAPMPPPPGALAAYPFFAYYDPGARLFPSSWFSTSLAVADALRAGCRFEVALQWYRRAFDPLQLDCTWMHCLAQQPDPEPTRDPNQQPNQDEIGRKAHQLWVEEGQPANTAQQDWLQAQTLLSAAATATSADPAPPVGACCDSTDVTDATARERVITLRYCRTLLEWGDSLRRRRRFPEASAQARLLYDTAARILGERPTSLQLPEPAAPRTVSAWTAAYAPLNPQLLDLYDQVAERQALVHRRIDERRIRDGRLHRDLDYFGDSPLREGWRTGSDADPCGQDPCLPASPYRFLSQIQHALELAGRVKEFGAALLAAYEKVDAEYLASIHAQQDREMLALGIAVRQDQWRDADWQVQALQATKDVQQTNLLYTAGLYRTGLINNEVQNLALTVNAMQTRTSANTTEAIGEAMNIVPDFFVGAMSTFSQIPIGTKLAGLFQVIGKVMQTIADIQSTNAGLDMTQASWDRRSAEWLHQMQTLQVEIQQVELQILGAHRRRDQALDELNNQQRQLEHAAETQDFLRDKFTATDLYQWLRKETAGSHARLYDLALAAARQAERAFNVERGHTTRRFVPDEPWDDLHQGLTAGDRLVVALQQMEKAYHDENRRELELTKHLSLRVDFPLAYLQLRTTGYCEIDVPEWMFDRDYPGHYLRRIRNVTLTLPCVAGPYTGVHCRLTLLSSSTRVHPDLRPPAHACCGQRHGPDDDYRACPDDPRIVREYAARESIATSSGQNDSGLFELNFNDERYLPFEYQGAISRWRIELPPKNNYFDLDTVTDAVLHLNYTARDGGDLLRAAAAAAGRERLPGDGLRLFDVRQDFPDAWAALQAHRPEPFERRLDLRFRSAMFPFAPGRRERRIEQLLMLIDSADAVEGDHHVLHLHPSDHHHDHHEDHHHDHHEDVVEGTCFRDDERPELNFGAIDLAECPLGPIDERSVAGCTLEIPAALGEIRRVFVVARYTAPIRFRA